MRTWNKKYQPYLIPVILLIFMAIAFLLRAIPVLVSGNTCPLQILDSDTYYNFRQIEVMVHHFPQYNWFDPMTAFPEGKTIDWGPLYPFIAATVCLITGATSRSAIMSTACWVTPLMAVIMVPVMYKLGTMLWNRTAGIVAAGLISILSFQYFLYSSYGYVDHHIAEVLFTTLFFLVYLFTLAYLKRHPVDLKSVKTLYIPVFLSALTVCRILPCAYHINNGSSLAAGYCHFHIRPEYPGLLFRREPGQPASFKFCSVFNVVPALSYVWIQK